MSDETNFRNANSIINAGFSCDKNSFTVVCYAVDKSLQEGNRAKTHEIWASTYQIAEAMEVGAVTPLAVAQPLVWA